jgi:hypothetical protein
MATGEPPTATSPPPPYSAVDSSKGGGQAPYPPYPTDGHQGGYPTPQTNQPYPGGYPPPGAYPPAGYPPPPGYPPAGGYPPQQGYYPGPTTQQPVVVHTTTTSAVIVHAGDRCVRCSGGRVTEHFTLGGICCAICLFPCGIICCLSSRIRSCNNCGAVYM